MVTGGEKIRDVPQAAADFAYPSSDLVAVVLETGGDDDGYVLMEPEVAREFLSSLGDNYNISAGPLRSVVVRPKAEGVSDARLLLAYAGSMVVSIERKPDDALEVRRLGMTRLAARKHAYAVESAAKVVYALAERGHSIRDAIRIVKEEFPRIRGYSGNEMSRRECSREFARQFEDMSGEPMYVGETEGMETYYAGRQVAFLKKYGLDTKVEGCDDCTVVGRDALLKTNSWHKEYTAFDGIIDYAEGKVPEFMDVLRPGFVDAVLAPNEHERRRAITKLEEDAYEHGLYALGEVLLEQYFDKLISEVGAETPFSTEAELKEEEPKYMKQAEKVAEAVIRGSGDLNDCDLPAVQAAVVQQMLYQRWHEKVLKRVNGLIENFTGEVSRVYMGGIGDIPGVTVPGEKEPLPPGWTLERYLQEYEASDGEIWRRYNDRYKELDRHWLSFAMTSEEWDQEVKYLALDVAAILLTGFVTGVVKKGVANTVLKKSILRYGVQEAFLAEASRVAVEKGMIRAGARLTLRQALSRLTDRQLISVTTKAMGPGLSRRLLSHATVWGSRMAGTAAQAPLFHTALNTVHEATGREADWSAGGYARSAVALGVFGSAEYLSALSNYTGGSATVFMKELGADTASGIGGFYTFSLGSFVYDTGRLPGASENARIVQKSAMMAVPLTLAGRGVGLVARGVSGLPRNAAVPEVQASADEAIVRERQTESEWVEARTTVAAAIDEGLVSETPTGGFKINGGGVGKRVDSRAPYIYSPRRSPYLVLAKEDGRPHLIDLDIVSRHGEDISWELTRMPVQGVFRIHVRDGRVLVEAEKPIIIDGKNLEKGMYEILPGDKISAPDSRAGVVRVGFVSLKGTGEGGLVGTQAFSVIDQPKAGYEQHPVGIGPYLRPIIERVQMLRDPEVRVLMERRNPEAVSDDPFYEVYTQGDALAGAVRLGDAQAFARETAERISGEGVFAPLWGPWIYHRVTSARPNGRIYLNINPERAAETYIRVAKGVPHTDFKMWSGLVGRGDRAVIYFRRKATGDVLDSIIGIHRDTPGAFNHNIPLFAAQVVDPSNGEPVHGVSFGEHPVEIEGEHGRSFGSMRADAVKAAVDRYEGETGEGIEAVRPDSVRLDVFEREFREAGVDTERPAFNAGSFDSWRDLHPYIDQGRGDALRVVYVYQNGRK